MTIFQHQDKKKLKKAIQIACQAMEKEIQRIAVDANLFERYGRPFHGASQSKRRKEMKEAIIILKGLLDPEDPGKGVDHA